MEGSHSAGALFQDGSTRDPPPVICAAFFDLVLDDVGRTKESKLSHQSNHGPKVSKSAFQCGRVFVAVMNRRHPLNERRNAFNGRQSADRLTRKQGKQSRTVCMSGHIAYRPELILANCWTSMRLGHASTLAPGAGKQQLEGVVGT